MKDIQASIHAEQSLIGALLIDNNALDRITDFSAEHFYRHEHKTIFNEICRQVTAGKRVDALTIFEKVGHQVDDCLQYLVTIEQNTPSSANITQYAAITTDKAIKRALAALGAEMQDIAASNQDSAVLVDLMASKLEALASKKVTQDPQRLSEMLGGYADMIQSRIDGKVRPVKTGFDDLDRMLSGGIAKGTLTVIAGRPGCGKTAAGLCIARNVAEWGSALFLSMEMSRHEINDRNISAIGKLPLCWLTNPGEKTQSDIAHWDAMTHAFARSQELNIFIDDKTALNMLAIRGKTKLIKRKHGLDLLVIDQLSFITGGNSDKSWEVVGEHTRALLQLAKESDIAVILLCQLNRKCDDRTNKRPGLSDLAVSGSIEQDASNIIFLYRDEIYNPDTQDKGVCEWIISKQRQGQPGTVALSYIADQTRFENMAYQWQAEKKELKKSRGFS